VDEISSGKKKCDMLDAFERAVNGIVAPERKSTEAKKLMRTCVSCMVLVTLAITRPSEPKEMMPAL